MVVTYVSKVFAFQGDRIRMVVTYRYPVQVDSSEGICVKGAVESWQQ